MASVPGYLHYCSVADCEQPVGTKGAKGMCSRHYQRDLRGVDVVGRHCATCATPIPSGFQQAGTKYCSEECKPRCAVDGCDSPQRKRTWCASHYSQWTRTGEEPKPFKYKWSEATPCLVCGGPPGDGNRQFCSTNCRARWHKYDGAPPDLVECVACGAEMDLHERGVGGQRRKASTKFCRPCKQDYSKYKASARELAARDGAICGICGEEVDMSLRRSDSIMVASVDHIVPRALGGSHDPLNLQLAHLYCNMVKSDGRGMALHRGGD